MLPRNVENTKQKFIDQFAISKEILEVLEVHLEERDFKQICRTFAHPVYLELFFQPAILTYLSFSSKNFDGYKHHYTQGNISAYCRGQHSLVHLSAFAGNIGALNLLLNAPYRHSHKNFYDCQWTALRCAAENNEQRAMQFLMLPPHYCQLKEKDSAGSTVLHALCTPKYMAQFYYFFLQYPDQSAYCWWEKNSHGDFLYQRPGLAKWLDQYLLETTIAILQEEAVDTRKYELLEAFSERWRVTLLTSTREQAVIIQKIVENNQRFSSYENLKKIIFVYKDVFALRGMPGADQPLTASHFRELLSLTKHAMGSDKFRMNIFQIHDNKFLKTLMQCLKSNAEEQLSMDVFRTINVIICDYERFKPNNEVRYLNKLLIDNLLASSSIAVLRPNTAPITQMHIGENNYLEHLATMRQKFSVLPATEEVRRLINDIVFPGIHHLIDHRATIIQHIEQHYGVLYYLVPGHKVLFTQPPKEPGLDIFYFYNNSEGRLVYSIKTANSDLKDCEFSSAGLDREAIQTEISNGRLELNNEHIQQAISVELKKSGIELRLNQLPFHTDHGQTQSPEETDKLLHRLLKEIIGAYYHCEVAGQLPEFFNRFSSGYCLEGRITSILQWSIAFSEARPVDEIMEEAIANYCAYAKVMENATEKTLCNRLNSAAYIISCRCQDLPCVTHPDYAPAGRITTEGVKNYLANVLAFEEKQLQCLVM